MEYPLCIKQSDAKMKKAHFYLESSAVGENRQTYKSYQSFDYVVVSVTDGGAYDVLSEFVGEEHHFLLKEKRKFLGK